MLALKGYEKASGFSVLNTDELFFISGGSAEYNPIGIGPLPGPEPTPPERPCPPGLYPMK